MGGRGSLPELCARSPWSCGRVLPAALPMASQHLHEQTCRPRGFMGIYGVLWDFMGFYGLSEV